jgi:predicted Zn-dependent protease
LESQAKGLKPEQQKLYYSKSAHYAEQLINRSPNPTADNYFTYVQVLYYSAVSTPEKIDMDLLKKSQVQAEKALLMVTHPKEQLWGMLNAIMLQQGDYVRCAEIVELLVKLFPNNKTYWLQLQQFYLSLGVNEKDSKKALEYNIRAIVTMERAQALGQLITPRDNFILVSRYYDIGQFGRVSELLQAGLRNGSIENLQQNWEILAVAFQQINKELKAIEALKEAETHFPKAGSLHYLISQIYYGMDNQEQAYNEAMKALEVGNIEKPGAIYCSLTYLAYNLAKYDEALVAVNKALEYPEGKKDPQIPRLKGVIQNAIKERDFAQGTPPDQAQQPPAGQKKQPEAKQSKGL